MDVTRLRPAKAGEVRRVATPAGNKQRAYITACPGHLIAKRVRGSLLARLLHGRKLPFVLPAGKCPPIGWMSHEALVALCRPYDVISFDVFDTLLVRTAGQPEQVFRLLEMQRGQLDFAQARQKAEAAARREHGGEITLRMIYDRLAQDGVVEDAAAAAEAEIAAELAAVKASPRMLALVRALTDAGKRVAAVSDMYLSSGTLEKLLDKAGYPKMERIFVSCEAGVGKAGGALQRHACEALGTTNVLHIGDNWQADVQGAARAGLDAAWVCHQQEPDTLSAVTAYPSLAAQTWRALVNQRLNGGEALPDAAYGVGYAVGGILAWGYCQWLHEQKQLRGWDRLLFAARDGYPLYRLYTKYFGEADYLPISRAAAQMLDAQESVAAYVDNNLYARISTGETLGDALAGLGLADCALAWAGEADMDQPITAQTLNVLRQLMIRDRGLVELCFGAARDNAERYYRQLLAGAKRAAVIDTGWKGSSTATLQRFLKKIGVETCIDSVLLGTSKSGSVTCQEDAGRLFSYLYSPSRGTHIFRRQFRRRCAVCCSLTEMLFVTSQPPLLSYAPSGEADSFTYGEADECAAALSWAQQQGIMDFAADYHGAMSAMEVLPPVSPEVAYAPFDALTRRGDLLLKVWGSYRHTAAPTARRGEGTVADMLLAQRWITRWEYGRWQQEMT